MNGKQQEEGRGSHYPGSLLWALLAMIVLAGCSTTPAVQSGEEPKEPIFSASRLLSSDVKSPTDIHDPLEGFNRGMYEFNYGFDRYIFLPVVAGYQRVTPEVAQQGVHNFFNNLLDLKTLINQLFQLKGGPALKTFSRMGWNTTLGLLGVIDVASSFDIPRYQEDFGQTLGHYGVGPGPYLVLPLLGPSNLRDGTGLVVDSMIFSAIDPLRLDGHIQRQIVYYGLNAIDQRAHIDFRYHQTGSLFEYDLIRMLYQAKRELEIEK
jgi:phospholipid-binding lipoprotein MlaA